MVSNDDVLITVASGQTVTGTKSGLYSTGSALNLDNAGTIRGDGGGQAFFTPNGGVLFTGGPAFITNSGSISGTRFGITSFYYFADPDLGVYDGRTFGSSITNSGSIIGDTDDGVRLIGGGTVTNSGNIFGRISSGADGISMFSMNGQPLDSFVTIGSVLNYAGGHINGNRFGVILSNGGSVSNAGTIAGNSGSIVLQAQLSDPGRPGSVLNTGTLNGEVIFTELATATLSSSGAITGALNGVSSSSKALSVSNSGTIRGNGTNAFTANSNGGIAFNGGPGAISNSGTITGARFGVTSYWYTFDPDTMTGDGRAKNSSVSNSGTIIGDNDDGVRLMGGGSVVNSGTISGRVSAGADGISIFNFNGQPVDPATGTGSVTNLAGGVIDGKRFAIILSGGGTINNAGTLNGGTNGAILVQGTGPFGTVINSGTVNGTTNLFGLPTATVTNSGAMTNFVSFGSNGNATLTNSGSIATTAGDAVQSTSKLSITNTAAGTITGSASGIFDHGSGLSLTNAGTIRGNGDIGVAIDGGAATITNSGTIYGRTTAIAGGGSSAGTAVTNSGTIRSDTGVAVNLLGGSVTNSGNIQGTGYGVRILTDAAGAPTMNNLVGGKINNVGLAAGGVVTNGGTIGGSKGSTAEALSVWATTAGKTASITSTGRINGRVVVRDVANATININGSIDLGLSSLRPTDPATPRGIDSNSPTTLTVGPSGFIFALVKLSEGADTVVLEPKSHVSSIDTGGGQDVVRLSGSGPDFKRSGSVPWLTGVERLEVTGSNWTVSFYDALPVGTTTISNGILQVNQPIVGYAFASPVTINGGGILASYLGSVQGNIIVNGGGSISPGGIFNGWDRPISTLAIAGNVAFNSGSALAIDAASDGTGDRLNVSGAVTISNAASVKVVATGNYKGTTNYTILSATGGINGAFGSVTVDSAFLTPGLSTSANAVTLSLTRNSKSLTTAASSSTLGVASVVSTMPESNPIYQAVVGQSLAGAAQGFASLSGGSYATLDERLANGFGHARLDMLGGETAQVDWTGTASLSAQGGFGGAAYRRGPFSMMMTSGRYADRVAADSINADVDTRFIAGTLGFRTGRVQALMSMATADHEVALTRAVRFPAYADAAHARVRASTQRLDLEGSYALVRGALSLQPYAGYAHVIAATKAFREDGGSAALSFDGAQSAVDQFHLGVRARGTVQAGAVMFTPHLDASVERSWGDLAGTREARFNLGGSTFDSMGAGFDRQALRLGGGVDVRLGPVALGATYRGRYADRSTDHSALLKAALPF